MSQNYRTSFLYRNVGTYPGGAVVPTVAGLSKVTLQVRSSVSDVIPQLSRSTVSKIDSTTGQVS